MPSKPSEEVRRYNREYYRRNRERLLEKQRYKNRRFAEGRRKWLSDYKKNLKCCRCEENHPAALTFHHRDSSTKEFDIGNAINLGVGLNRLMAEIEKCDVLCANCHAKEHYSQMFE